MADLDVALAEKKLATRSVRTSTGCLEWTGTATHKGYGFVRVSGHRYATHRLAYELRHGPIPAGRLVCHRCDNPRCVDPDHLFIGTCRYGERTWRVGEKHHNAIVPDAVAWHIRAARRAGASYGEIAVAHGVTVVTVKTICTQRRWMDAIDGGCPRGALHKPGPKPRG